LTDWTGTIAKATWYYFAFTKWTG